MEYARSAYRVGNFITKRFSDIGIGTSPQVNRLIFKNQEYKEFVDREYLETNQYINDKVTYEIFMSAEICPETKDEKIGEGLSKVVTTIITSLPKTKVLRGGGKDEHIVKGGTIDPVTLGVSIGSTAAAVATGKYVLSDTYFFKFNNEVNVPFRNVHIFNFLHMYKYTLTKSYSKGRFLRTYRMIDGLVELMTNNYYTDLTIDEYQNTPPDQVFYKKTFIYALRRKFTNGVNAFFAILKQKGSDIDLKKKKKCSDEAVQSYAQSIYYFFSDETQASQQAAKTTLANGLQDVDIDNLDAEESENNEAANASDNAMGGGGNGDDIIAAAANGDIKGGKKSRKRHFIRTNKTRKIKGGFLLYTSRLYRILNMHLDTVNIFSYSSEQITLLTTYGYNYFANVATIKQIPIYLVKEQLRFLLLGLIYLLDNSKLDVILSARTYDDLTIVINNLENYSQRGDPFNSGYFEKLLERLKNIDIEREEVYYTFVKEDSKIHRELKELLINAHSLVRGLSLNITRIKLIFKHAANCMFYEYTRKMLMEDPVKNAPEGSATHRRLSEYYRSESDTNGSKKNLEVVDFLVTFVTSNIMAGHFACSQLTGVALGHIANVYANATEIVTSFVLQTLGKFGKNGFTAVAMGITLAIHVSSIAVMAITSLINTPNCWMSMGLMFYIMLFSIQPLMPREGTLRDSNGKVISRGMLRIDFSKNNWVPIRETNYTYMPKQDVFNGKFYKTMSSLTQSRINNGLIKNVGTVDASAQVGSPIAARGGKKKRVKQTRKRQIRNRY